MIDSMEMMIDSKPPERPPDHPHAIRAPVVRLLTSTPQLTYHYYAMRLVLFTAALCSALATAQSEQNDFFESKVRPLLATKCLVCHSDSARAGLRLDSRAAVLKGGKSGPAIIPGDPANSLLIQAVAHKHATLRMPPGPELEPHQVGDLEKWVRDGALWPETTPKAAISTFKISPEQKAFWSFQPVRKSEIPAIGTPNPIDRFILASLKDHNLTPGKKADRSTLIRRVTLDLTGLPPTPSQIQSFESDLSPNALEKVIDRLLETPQYGERWGRHWLDLVRYADTAGDAADFPVPEMYKYRNYVIDAFQNDKPYNQFLKEQIAGDLLPYANDAQRWEQIVATGYITVSRRIGVSPTSDRHITIEDTIDNVGKNLLGLSVGCARCHDHKFDPIPTADYYALYGIFDSSIYPASGEEHNPYRKGFIYRIGNDKAAEVLKPYDEQFATWKKQERAKFNEYQEFQDKKITTPGRSREVVWAELTKVRQDLRPAAEAYPPLETAWAVSEGKPHDVKIQIYGDPKNTGAQVPRGFPQILGGMKVPEGESGSGRRQLAEWIADPKNPLVPRVIANRIWHYHFGKGIVASTSDFGVRGTPPTHPELLDYLASRFIEDGWSFKKMHKLILLSDAWQRASADVPSKSATDPQNNFFWRQNRTRLDAEEISDGIRLMSAELDLSRGERLPFPNERTYFYRQHEPFNANWPNMRRAVYGLQQRTRKNPILDLFDGPDGNLPFSERRSTTTSLQALYLMNSEFMTKQSAMIANSLTGEGKLAQAYQLIFGRAIKPQELTNANEFLTKLRQQHQAAGCNDCDAKAWTSYIHSMLASNAFLFVD